MANLYTIRVGELVRDNIHETLSIANEEMIKIRETEAGKGCIYYDPDGKACTIYDHRPAQCAALACWDVSEFMRVYKCLKAARKDIVRDKVLLGLIEKHEEKCGYQAVEDCVNRIELEGEKSVNQLIALLKFDYHLRPFVSEKLGIKPTHADFLFGRPLTVTITMFGLKVTKEPDGSFFLTALETDQER